MNAKKAKAIRRYLKLVDVKQSNLVPIESTRCWPTQLMGKCSTVTLHQQACGRATYKLVKKHSTVCSDGTVIYSEQAV